MNLAVVGTPNHELGDSKIDRNRGTVAPDGIHLAPDPDDLRLPGLEIPRDISIVPGAMLGRHQQVHAPSDDVSRAVAKHPFGSPIERADDAAFVDGDDAVERVVL